MSISKDPETTPSPGSHPHNAPIQERRRFVRIEDQVALKYSVIPKGSLEERVTQLRKAPPSFLRVASHFAANSRQMTPMLGRIRAQQPELACYLAMVNKKLDLLARSLSITDHELADEPARKVNLSAGGISFCTERELPPKTILELKLFAFPSLLYLVTFGTVRRCARIDESEQGFCFLVAIEFNFITEEDREMLVQHIVQRELSQLRARRATAS